MKKSSEILFFFPDKIHYLGGRFINPRIAKEYGIEDIVNKYQGDELIVKL